MKKKFTILKLSFLILFIFSLISCDELFNDGYIGFVTPTPDPDMEYSPTPAVTPTVTPTITGTPIHAETPTPTDTQSSVTPTPTYFATPTATPTASETVSPTVTETVLPTESPSVTATPSATPTATPTATPVPEFINTWKSPRYTIDQTNDTYDMWTFGESLFEGVTKKSVDDAIKAGIRGTLNNSDSTLLLTVSEKYNPVTMAWETFNLVITYPYTIKNDILILTANSALEDVGNPVKPYDTIFFKHPSDDALLHSKWSGTLYYNELKVGNTISLMKLYNNETMVIKIDKLGEYFFPQLVLGTYTLNDNNEFNGTGTGILYSQSAGLKSAFTATFTGTFNGVSDGESGTGIWLIDFEEEKWQTQSGTYAITH